MARLAKLRAYVAVELPGAVSLEYDTLPPSILLVRSCVTSVALARALPSVRQRDPSQCHPSRLCCASHSGGQRSRGKRETASSRARMLYL